MTTTSRSISSLVLASLLGAAVGCGHPTIESFTDVTGLVGTTQFTFVASQILGTSDRVTQLQFFSDKRQGSSSICPGQEMLVKVSDHFRAVRRPGTWTTPTTNHYDGSWPDDGFQADLIEYKLDSKGTCLPQGRGVNITGGTLTIDHIDMWWATGTIEIEIDGPTGHLMRGRFVSPRSQTPFD